MKYLLIVSFLWALFAEFIFPWCPIFIFRPRAFGIVLPFTYILIAYGLSKVRWRWVYVGIGVLCCFGIAETVMESLHPTYMIYRTMLDTRVLARSLAKSLQPWEMMRGTPNCDGPAMVEYMWSQAARSPQPPTSLYLFSDSLHETIEFLKTMPGPSIIIAPLGYRGSVVLYRLTRQAR